jgi:hypothetical protein
MKYVPPAITKVESAKMAFGSKKNSSNFGSVKIGNNPDSVDTFTSAAGYVANE